MRSEKRVREREAPFYRLTCLQIGVCLLLFGVVFAAFKLNPDFFESLKTQFTELTENDLGTSSVSFFDIGSQWEKKERRTQEDGDDEDEDEGDEDEGDEDAEDAAASADPGQPDTQPSEESAAANAPSPAFVPAGSTGAPLVQMGFQYDDRQAVLPVNGTVTSVYGARIHPVYGGESFHSGVDLATAEGTPVHAALDGTVSAVGVGESSGNYVKITHDGGRETMYCHLSAVNVSVGISVRKGDVVGFVGHTGLATGPHLHFELKIDGEKVDPAVLLEDAVDVSDLR